MCDCCCGDDRPAVFRAPPLIAAALSRSHLRETRRRLIAIRGACGFQDKDDDGSKGSEDEEGLDPFTRIVRRFHRQIDEARFAAADSINDMAERVQIKKNMEAAKVCLQELRDVVQNTHSQLNTAQLKNTNPEKVARLRAAFANYQETVDRCEQAYEEAQQLTDKLTWNAPSQLGQSPAYRKAVRMLAEKSGVAAALDAADAAARESAGGDEPDAELANITLDDDPETKEQMMVIKKQKNQVRLALTRIGASVERVKDMALLLHQETTTQILRLSEVDEHMKYQIDNIRHGNARLEKLLATMQPMNCCVNVTIFIIVLSCVGFLLYRFDVVPIDSISK